MELTNLIKKYLEEARLMQVATAKENQPWACSVYFAYDDNLNLFWISTPERRHSKEIAENEKVAGTIVLPHTPGDKVRGIQFQGVAKRLASPEEMQHGMQVYAARMGTKEERKKNILQGKDNHVPYMIKPSLYVLFDELNFPMSPRQELQLHK